MLIGVEVLVVGLTPRYIIAGLLRDRHRFAARLISVGLPVMTLRRWERFQPALIPILVWGGLRGGISVALALSLRGINGGGQSVDHRELIVTITYVVVVFSILVQGLTVGPLTRALTKTDPSRAQDAVDEGARDGAEDECEDEDEPDRDRDPSTSSAEA